MKFFALGLLAAGLIPADTYEVGPDKDYAAIGDVPWESLNAGDTVLIYWQPDPYRDKWVICLQGSADAPITVRGVAGPDGQLPVIDGNGATTRAGLDYWNGARGVLKIGGASFPPDTMPRYIVIENLEIRGARPPYTYTYRDAVQTYAMNAAAIYVEKAENLTIRNCILHDSGNGLFIGTSNDGVTRDILVESNYIYDNGNVGSAYEHNSYTEALGITFQYNHYGPLRAGANGNSLKDRSAGLVVRYNWIEGGNRELDLVDAGPTSVLSQDKRYRETYVYGNLLIEPTNDGNRQIVHYGGDGGDASGYRKGTLFFFNNTVISNRTDRTTLFRLSTNDEHCDARNNIFYVTLPGDSVSLLDSSGVSDLTHNWIKPGWRISFGQFDGAVNDDGTMLEDDSPGFLDEASQDFHLAPDSLCIGAGTVTPVTIDRQYVKHQAGESRQFDPPDIGALSDPAVR